MHEVYQLTFKNIRKQEEKIDKKNYYNFLKFFYKVLSKNLGGMTSYELSQHPDCPKIVTYTKHSKPGSVKGGDTKNMDYFLSKAKTDGYVTYGANARGGKVAHRVSQVWTINQYYLVNPIFPLDSLI